MCFKNLPIEFDEHGRPYLREDGEDPYSLKRKPAELHPAHHIAGAAVEAPEVREHWIDPITRVAGALGLHTVVDLKQRKILDAHSMATLFRGYEVILRGRDPRDAVDLSSRACGVCGAVHSTCSSLALEMAFPVKPPPMGVVAKNLGEAAEFLYDHPLHLFLLAGPDFSASTLQATNPSIWERAKATPAPHAALHGYQRIGGILEALNPLTGELYREALEITRVAREMCMLMYGKYPHPSTLVPGGVTTTLSFTSFNEYYTRLVRLFDYSKKCVAIWDDVFDFLYEANPEYRKVGMREINMIGTGIFDDPDAYDADYLHCNEWGERRLATPGVMVNGELRTTKLQEINIGIEEFVEHSFYDQWNQKFLDTDPAGNPLSPHHMWNKWTSPKPTGRSFKDKYTWDSTPRWDRMVMEAGCYTRIWFTAVAQKVSNDFIKPTGHSLKMLVPKHQLPEMELEWKVPTVLNAIERNRARAYCVPWMALVAMVNLLKAFELLRRGEDKVHTTFEIPRRGRQVGAGFWEAGRGYLTHHCILEDGKIFNYQILTPSTWNASPRDPWGQPGAYEQAMLNTPILEEFRSPNDYKGIDVQRTVRSFDPCMPCTTHIVAGDRVIMRDVTSCACTFEEVEETPGR